MENEIKEKILKVIGEVWQETKEQFGDAFPFEDDLEFKIIDNGKEFPGTITFEPKIKMKKDGE